MIIKFLLRNKVLRNGLYFRFLKAGLEKVVKFPIVPDRLIVLGVVFVIAR